jgi:drug/metabolite transporter (DMT)-like permease
MTASDLLHSGEFSAAFCALVWAFAVILFRRSGESVPPVALNLFKTLVALPLFLLSLPLLGVPLFDGRASDWAVLLVSGVLGIAVADSLFFASLNRLGAGRSAIVDCLYSPLVVLCSFVYLDEPLGPGLLVAMGLMAAAILVGAWQPGAPVPAGTRRALHVGVGLGVLAMLSMAVAIVLAKPVIDRVDPWWATTVRLTGGAVVLTVQGALPRHRRSVLAVLRPGPVWRVALPAAFLGNYVALIFWILGFKYAQTTVASVLNQLSTIFILVLATIFLREPLTPRKSAAVAMGVAAGLIVSFGPA